jgi:hypothetical protein
MSTKKLFFSVAFSPRFPLLFFPGPELAVLSGWYPATGTVYRFIVFDVEFIRIFPVIFILTSWNARHD